MKKEEIIDALNDIDDKYIEQAHSIQKKKFDFSLFSKLAVAAVCLALVVTIIPRVIPRMGSNGAKEDYFQSTESTYDMAVAEEGNYSNEYISDEDTGYVTNATDIHQNNKKLIVTGNISVETNDFDNYINNLKNKVESVGGYFQSSSIDIFDSEQRHYYATIRVPAETYNDFLSGIKENVNVTNYNEFVDDITDTYSDLKARQESLKAEESKVMEFYNQATNLDELMNIEARLTEIRYEIDHIESRIKNYDTLTNYSTLNINIRESKVYTKNTNFFEKLGTRFINGLNNFVNVVQDIILDLAYNFLQIILVIAAIIVIVKIGKKILKK